MTKCFLWICTISFVFLIGCDKVVSTSDSQSTLQSSLFGNWLDTVIVNDTTNLIDSNGNEIFYLVLALGKSDWSFAMSMYNKSNGIKSNLIRETYFAGRNWAAATDSLSFTGSWKDYDSTNTIVDSSISLDTYRAKYQKSSSRQLIIWNFLVGGQQYYKLQ
jgi:hypothetical protein